MSFYRPLAIAIGVAAAASIPLQSAVRRAFETPAPKQARADRPQPARAAPPSKHGPVPVLKAELGTSPASTAPPQRVDPLGNPIIGEEHREVTASGDKLYSAELAPGYDDVRPLSEADELTEPQEGAPAQPKPLPKRPRPDPRQYGYESLEAMEATLRRRLKIPDDLGVALSTEERDGRQGVVIDVFPRNGVEGATRERL